ncbi:palmitoyltransferase ZDHHC6-like [Homarus americanus]|uniref:Palmitoyltransferase n=1 Tax=Homarus americanus TaxID=6706 RepID=A0A8J5J7X9_HOMAM|nr:palmitoyltransferase ZDHHC6-like [Homarus americanus]KAG7154392.1 Palmitoyltransferase ZDHHC6-like [Homarus americanus]
MCVGPLKRVCHWGPLIALGIIKWVTLATVSCLSQWWPPDTSWGGSFIFLSFMTCAVLTLYCFLHAMYTGPGTLPPEWHPENESDKQFLQFCAACEGYKAPRSHHCRKCGCCVMKMDHHCPWINNCVGHKNHGSFTFFLFFAVLGCAQATVVLSLTIYHAIHRTWYIYYGTGTEPIVYMSLWGMVLCMFVLGLAIGVVLAVGMLLYFQVRAILRNRTGIEDWILEKAIHRRDSTDEPFIYPYNLGRWNNFVQVINVWCEPNGDGIEWTVREECNQYTLTIEQLAQKAEKRARSQEYHIVEGFSGWWFPCTKGICVCCHPPCTDEPRIRLYPGDEVIVTRWKKYWLYGERINSSSSPTTSSGDGSNVYRHRGWFPRRCAVQILCTKPEADAPSSSPSSRTQKQTHEKTMENKKKR